jgi:hypothetical protein
LYLHRQKTTIIQILLLHRLLLRLRLSLSINRIHRMQMPLRVQVQVQAQVLVLADKLNLDQFTVRTNHSNLPRT